MERERVRIIGESGGSENNKEIRGRERGRIVRQVMIIEIKGRGSHGRTPRGIR